MALPTDWKDRIQKQEGITTLALGPQAYVETRDPRYVSDAYQYYLQGMGGGQDAAAAPTAKTPTAPVNTGGGGGGAGITAASAVQPTAPATGGGVNTPFEQNLINQGAGVQIAPGQPVVAPGEVPVTQAEIDAFNQIPVNREFGAPMNIGFGEGQVDPKLAAAVGGKDTTPVGGGNLVTTASGDVFAANDPMLQEKIDFTPEQQGTIQNILGQAGQTVSGALSAFGQIPGAIVDAANQTVDLFGKKINVGKTLAASAINKIAGGPVSLVFEAAKALLPEDNIKNTTKVARKTGLLTGDTTVTQDKYGINTQSAFGNYDQYNIKQVDKLQNRLDELNPDVNPNSKYKTQEDYLKNTKRLRQELEDRNKYLDEKGLKGVGDVDSGRGSGLRPTVDDATGVNPFADIDTGVGEFDTTPTTAPATGTVLGKPGIERFDDAEASIDMFEDTAPITTGGPPSVLSRPTPDNILADTGDAFSYLDDVDLPSGASKTGTPVDALNPINRQQHLDNTEKLKDAVREGKISNETYNRLSAFDARKTMGLGAVTGTLASGAYQGAQTGAGILRETLGLNPAFAGDQSAKEAIDDTIRNIQGVSGNITPEEQIQYQEIISGEDIYRDPIMGMVDQPTKGTLAGEPGLPDLMDEFDMTAFDEPTAEPDSMEQRLDDLIREKDLGVGPQFDEPTPMEQRLDDLIREKDLGVGPQFDDEDDFEVSGDIAPGGMDQVLGKPVDTSIPDRGRGGGADRDPAPSKPSFDPGGYGDQSDGGGEFDTTPSAPTGISGPPSRGGSSGGPPSQGGGGGDPGGGSKKIVCTMMNESYGFGSFRNKIWLRHSKDLAPEYQIGYHKIFLPLVKLSKKNIVLKKVLEHIAVHRTIDIRQESRGKVHLLGRIYRKVLEPICYWVGKYAKR